MTQKCYYEILNIPRTADLNTIKKSYKKLALMWHPDKNPNNKTEAEIMFKSISQAYEVLSDDAKRRIYDQHGHDGVNGNWRAPSASQTFDDDDDDSGRFDIFDLHDIFTFRDPHDIFREFFGTDPFDSIFGLASPFFDQSSSMIGGRMRRSNNLRQTRLNRHCQPYNVTTSAGGTGASRPASSQSHCHSQHDSSLSSAQQMCSPADILSPFSFGLGFMGGPFAGAFGGHHAASLFNMGPSMIDPGFGMFAATAAAAAANHHQHQHQYQSQGWAGSGASYRSTSTSTRIVNGKRVKTTKIVENGSETVTEEVDGIVVNKTVNGRSVAIAN